MSFHSHTTDATGFDYMANTGTEEQDRDRCGMLIAVVLIVVLTALQYAGVY